MSGDNDELKINQNIELEVMEGQFEGNYSSKVADITEKQLMVMAIYKKEELIPLRKGTKIKILYEGDDAFYSFKSTIIGRKKDSIPVLCIKPGKKINRIQRRKFFRVQINKDIKYLVLNNIKSDEKKLNFKKTTMIDLSGGGLKIVLKEDLKINDRLLFDLNIDGIDMLYEGKIVRIKYNTDGYSKTAGIEFVDMKRRDRDKIISYLFNYQRKLRRRGMI